ncbi:MAG TPA: DsbA family oxidoreductase [Kofleriaceae bacterium]
MDIWSDIACPWCYVGKRHLEQALETFPHKAEVEIVWRAFELDPSAPRVRDGSQSYVERIARKYGTPAAQAQLMIDRMVDTAARDGLDFRFDKIQPGNTFDAHRVVHLAHERGKQDAMKERLMRAYLTEGAAIGQPEVLAGLAREVRADEAQARELGIDGVPFFVLAGRLGVSGAQPAETLRAALDQAWSDFHPPGLETFAEGAACGPDGCA